MNPNSAHQTWSRWEYTIVPMRQPPVSEVRDNCARFGRKAFGSVAQMRVMLIPPVWMVSVLAEGVPVWDQAFVAWMHQQWQRFLENGFGVGSTIDSTARLMAGAVERRPPDQLIIVPTITVKE